MYLSSSLGSYCFLLLLGTTQSLASSPNDPFSFVDPLIGTANGGHVFAGASLPYGMAKAVADTTGDNTGGYSSDNTPITGFGQMHDSGTGGSASLGNFPLFPYAGCPGDDVSRCKFPKLARPQDQINGTVVSEPGYFAITLNSSVRTEMTTTEHTSLFRFSFPETPLDGSPLSPLILQDLSDLNNSRMNGTVTVDEKTGRISGTSTFLPSFGSGTYTLHFCTDFQGAPVRETGIFVNNRPGTQPKELFITKGINGFPLPGGAWTQFGTPTGANNSIMARTGISFISVEKACSNAESEIPDFNFEGVRDAAKTAWKQKLSFIEIDSTGVDDDYLRNFWSGVYRTMLSPQNYTGENPLWSDSPYFDSYYCIWDSFRAQHPFLTVVDPEAQTGMVNGLLNIYKNEGYLPDCRMSLCKGYTQGGSNADNVLGDAWAKGLRDGIDWQVAFDAVAKDANVEPLDWSNEGRGGMQSWKRLGYIPAEDYDYIGFGTFTRSISRTLEYSYNDFCVAEIGEGLGVDVSQYTNSSGNWKNLYNPKQTSFRNTSIDTGFAGFFQPRFLNQTFGVQDPLECSQLDPDPNPLCSLQNTAHETYEESVWEYSFLVQSDMAGLIATYGGPEAFIDRLSYLHSQGILYIGNEQAFIQVFQFHHGGRPGLSAYWSHHYIPDYFAPNITGLPGNDDSGAIGAFVAFNFLGFFPNPGQNVYYLIAPYFASVSITNPITGAVATIKNTNFDPTYKNIYIQSATLNGTAYTRNWIGHEFFLYGGTMEYVLGANESDWGTKEEDWPPSYSTWQGNLGNSMPV